MGSVSKPSLNGHRVVLGGYITACSLYSVIARVVSTPKNVVKRTLVGDSD